MTTNRLDSLEDRIQKPGYLLFLVVVLLLLIVGLVDLIDYEAEFPTIFGRYTPNYITLLVGYTLFLIAWTALFLKPNNDRMLISVLDFVQLRPVVAVGVLAAAGMFLVVLVIAGNLNVGDMLTLPAFQATMIAITLLFAGLVLFYQWGDKNRPQTWRKIVLFGLGLLLAVELLLQLLTYFGAYPRDLSTTTSIDHYSPYNRIYHSSEGFSNGLANNYGHYVPDFELFPDSYRISLLGDSFVEGIQVQKDQKFGVLIENHLTSDTQEGISEVITLGYPDIGPGLYLSNWMLELMVSEFKPDEAIAFFDLGSDFQVVDRPGTGYPYFVYEGDGQAQLDTSFLYRDLHKAEHSLFRGYQGFQPVLFLKSNYLTPRFLQSLVDRSRNNDGLGNEAYDSTGSDINLPNGFVFNEQTNENALRIASAQIKMANEQLNHAGVNLRLVTNPVFTENFYTQEAWNTVIGDSDLLLPERQLRKVATDYGISFLGLGTYMEAQAMSPTDVQELFFNKGLGHFTPKGHEFVAEAIYQCFYTQSLTAEEGCDVR